MLRDIASIGNRKRKCDRNIIKIGNDNTYAINSE
jgi:hypothetical protein